MPSPTGRAKLGATTHTDTGPHGWGHPLNVLAERGNQGRELGPEQQRWVRGTALWARGWSSQMPPTYLCMHTDVHTRTQAHAKPAHSIPPWKPWDEAPGTSLDPICSVIIQRPNSLCRDGASPGDSSAGQQGLAAPGAGCRQGPQAGGGQGTPTAMPAQAPSHCWGEPWAAPGRSRQCCLSQIRAPQLLVRPPTGSHPGTISPARVE